MLLISNVHAQGTIPTITSVSCSPTSYATNGGTNFVSINESTNCTVTVTAGVPAGETITFAATGNDIVADSASPTCNLNDSDQCQVIFIHTNNSVETTTITATYPGDGTYAGSFGTTSVTFTTCDVNNLPGQSTLTDAARCALLANESLVIDDNATSSNLTITTTNSTVVNVIITNETSSQSTFESLPADSNTIIILNISVTNSTPTTLTDNLTQGFAQGGSCDPSTVAPYIYNPITGTWTTVPSNEYTINATACTVTFNIPKDPVIGLFSSASNKHHINPHPNPPINNYFNNHRIYHLVKKGHQYKDWWS